MEGDKGGLELDGSEESGGPIPMGVGGIRRESAG